MIFTARVAGILCLALVAACAGLKEAPPSVMAPLRVDPSVAAPSNQDQEVVAEPSLPEAPEEVLAPAPPPAAPRQSAMTGDETRGSNAVALAPAPAAKNQSAASTVPPPAKAPVKGSASAAPIEQPRKIENPPPVAAKPEPPLDVAALKARLRGTNAIGVFTKLALKNQVDDLLKQFRAHYLSGQNSSVAALRQPYDMLVLKVLALVQDSDPTLARTISGSREAIWGILADPVKFNSVS